MLLLHLAALSIGGRAGSYYSAVDMRGWCPGVRTHWAHPHQARGWAATSPEHYERNAMEKTAMRRDGLLCN